MEPHTSRLFFVAPASGDLTLIQNSISAAAAVGDIAAVLVAGGDKEKRTSLAKALVPAAHDHDIAIIIEEDVECALETQADGVQISGDLQAYAQVREVIGKDLIVGVNSGNSKHIAMLVGEAGADYVAFEDTELARWWAHMFEVPCVALASAAPNEARGLAQDGVEFIRPVDDILRGGEESTRLMKHYCEMLAGIARR